MISGSLSPRHGAYSGCGWKNDLQKCRVAEKYLISSHGQETRGGPPAWALVEVLTSPRRKNVSGYEMFTQKTSDLDWLLRTGAGDGRL